MKQSNQSGFFEPHNSSIDFCESNYVYTRYCAEIWNSLSSLLIIVIAYITYSQSINIKPGPYFEELISREKRDIFIKKANVRGEKNVSRAFQIYFFPRFLSFWIILGMVGAGSFLFHGTLRRWAQACDELPMVIMNVVFLYSMFCCRKACMTKKHWADQVHKYKGATKEKLIQGKEANNAKECVLLQRSSVLESLDIEEKLWNSMYKFRGLVLILLGLSKIALYVIFENYVCFFAVFVLGVMVSVYACVHTLNTKPFARESNHKIYKKLFFRGLSIFLLGSTLWIVENMFCNALEKLHFHVIWHVFAGFGAALTVLSTLVNFVDSLGILVDDLRFKYGFFPIITFTF